MAAPTGNEYGSKLNDEMMQNIAKLLAQGLPISTVCKTVGIGQRTHYVWMERGNTEIERMEAAGVDAPEEREEKYVRYVQAVEKAQEECEVRNLALINAAARGGQQTEEQTTETFYKTGELKERKTIRKSNPPVWTAAAWILERLHPDRYGRKIRAEHSGRDGKPIEVLGLEVVTSVTPELDDDHDVNDEIGPN